MIEKYINRAIFWYSKMLDLYLMRHAESEINNRGNLIAGRSNESPLTERGKQQATLLGKRWHNFGISFDEIYSSPARRTIETAQIAGEPAGYSIDTVIITSELAELDQGDWEGKPRVEIYTPTMLKKINSDNWNFTPPNGESQKTVEERMLRWVNENLIPRYSDNLKVGIITHGMAIKCLLRGIMNFSPGITYKIALDNTSITRLQYSERGWHLLTVNDAAHLLSR